MHSATALRRELAARNREIAVSANQLHDFTAGANPSVIFGSSARAHGNFHPRSYKNICANAQWAKRLTKVHTQSRKSLPRAEWRWRELDSSNSSDALLMNVFCYTRSVRNPKLSSMLGVVNGLKPEFGFRPRIPLLNGRFDRTEVDMKLGELLVEAKLTETDFQTAPLRLIERYRGIDEVFDLSMLSQSGASIRGYQLVRGVLAAAATEGSFCVICDARRVDLIESWYSVMSAVQDCSLRCRLKLATWQELSLALPKSLQQFLTTKYGILTNQ